MKGFIKLFSHRINDNVYFRYVAIDQIAEIEGCHYVGPLPDEEEDIPKAMDEDALGTVIIRLKKQKEFKTYRTSLLGIENQMKATNGPNPLEV